MIAVEQLETRMVPGGLLGGSPADHTADLLLMAEMAPQRYPVDLPKADLAVIGTQQPSRYLDAAHDAIPRKIPERDVTGANSLNDTVDEFFFRKQKPISLIIVGTSTPGGSGFILGRNYFYAVGPGSESGASEAFWNHCRAKISDILVLVSADNKATLFQQAADGLTAGGVVTVSAYSGLMGVADGHFVTSGELQQWHSQ